MNRTIRSVVVFGLLSAATWLNACKSTPEAAPAATTTAAATSAPATSTPASTTPAAASAPAASTATAATPTAAPAKPTVSPMLAVKPPAEVKPAAPATSGLQTAMPMADKMYVVMETNKGSMVIELDHKNAPASVENFLTYVNSNYYNGTVFHRVIKDFMVQGGGFTTDLTQKPTSSPIKNEGGNGLPNSKYTLAMARTNDPNSATSQFFINTVDNPFLNSRDGRPGYAVFGKVIQGTEVVDVIRAVPTTRKPLNTPQGAAPFADVPVEIVEIISIKPLPGPPPVKK